MRLAKRLVMKSRHQVAKDEPLAAPQLSCRITFVEILAVFLTG
jgi:hypothetical protein